MGNSNQAAAYDHPPFDPTKVKYVPYIHFKDEAGSHRLQVREWGAYLLLGHPNYRDHPEALWGAPAYKKNRDTILVVGNMTNHRNNWLIIKTFQPDSESDKRPSLFEDLSPDEAPPRTKGSKPRKRKK